MLNIVNDHRIDELEKLINFYNEEDLNSTSKYNIYLKIKDVKERYFGRHNWVVPSGFDGFKNFFESYNMDTYTEEAKAEYIDKLKYYLIEVDKIESHANNELGFNEIEKNILAFNYDSGRNVYLNCECSLLSLKIKEGCRSSIRSNDERGICKISPLEYYKKDITFNFLKSDIEYIVIKDKNNDKVMLTVKEFEKKYCDIKWFIYKELYNQDIELLESISDERLKIVFKAIRQYAGLRVLPNLKYKQKLISGRGIGEYAYWTINVKEKTKYTPKLEVIFHEMGHFLHDSVFNNKQIRFPVKDKTRYAKKNYLENFAECFVDLIYCNKKNDRTKRMIDILQEIV